MSLQSLQIDRLAYRNAHDIRRSPMANRFEFVRDSLGEQKSGSEIEVIARRPHRHRHRPIADANLQRLFDDDDVFAARSARRRDARHRRRRNPLIAHFVAFTSSNLCVTR